MEKPDRKVLIIAYYWPPAGGGGVQRWVKFVKYLSKYGWQPIVYVPENADYPFYDDTLEKDIPESATIIRRKIWEPYSVYNKLSGGGKENKVNAGLISDGKKRSWLAERMIWIRGNWFIPDARKFWIKPSIRFLTAYLKENPVDAMISTGPPHSMHLIARGVKRNLGVKWIADFRDPWVHMDNNIEDLKYSNKTLRKHEALEMSCLKEADRVLTVSPTIVEDYEKLSGRKVDMITNGFDYSDFDFGEVHPEKDQFIVGHYGTLGKYRNPETMFRVLKELCQENERFNQKLVIQLSGTVDGTVLASIKENGLWDKLELHDYLTHSESIRMMAKASLLLLLLDKNASMKGRMTGKIFEYLATQNPILGLGYVHADPSVVLNETGAGELIDYDDAKGIREFILSKFRDQENNSRKDISAEIDKYSRESLTRDLAQLLNNLTNQQLRKA